MLGIAIEGKTASEAVSAALDKGLMALTAKDKIRLLPPLTITKEEIDEGVAILIEAIEC